MTQLCATLSLSPSQNPSSTGTLQSGKKSELPLPLSMRILIGVPFRAPCLREEQ